MSEGPRGEAFVLGRLGETSVDDALKEKAVEVITVSKERLATEFKDLTLEELERQHQEAKELFDALPQKKQGGRRASLDLRAARLNEMRDLHGILVKALFTDAGFKTEEQWRKEIDYLKGKLPGLKPGTPDYEEVEKDIAQFREYEKYKGKKDSEPLREVKTGASKPDSSPSAMDHPPQYETVCPTSTATDTKETAKALAKETEKADVAETDKAGVKEIEKAAVKEGTGAKEGAKKDGLKADTGVKGTEVKEGVDVKEEGVDAKAAPEKESTEVKSTEVKSTEVKSTEVKTAGKEAKDEGKNQIFSIQEVLGHIQSHRKHVFQPSKIDVVLILGKTGHGKSTTVNWLLGETIGQSILSSLVGGFKQRIKALTCETQRSGLTIGHSLFKSETFFLQGYPLPDTPLTLIDSPGLGDTKGVNIAIAHATEITRLLHRCLSVRPVLLISFKMFGPGVDRGRLLRTLLDEMQEFIRIDSDEEYSRRLPSLLVVWTHVDEVQDWEGIAATLGEAKAVYTEQAGTNRVIAFVEHVIQLLDTHRDLLVLRPHQNLPGPLKKLIMSLPPIRNPAEVFGCPLESHNRLQLQTACRAIKDSIKFDLENYNFRNVAKQLSDLHLLQDATGLPMIVEAYQAAIDLVLDHSHRKLDAANVAFNDYNFADTNSHMNVINETIRKHTDPADTKRDRTIEQRINDLQDKFHNKARDWTISSDQPVGSVDFGQTAQQLDWLKLLCFHLSSNMEKDDQQAYSNSLIATKNLIEAYRARAEQLIETNRFGVVRRDDEKSDDAKHDGEKKVQGKDDDDSGVQGNLCQCLDGLRDVQKLSNHIDEKYRQYYSALVSKVQLIANDKSELCKRKLGEIAKAESIAVDAEFEVFSPCLIFFKTMSLEYQAHMPGSTSQYNDLLAMLKKRADEDDGAIATHQQNYNAIVGLLRKLDLVCRLLNTDALNRRLLFEYTKLEQTAQRIQSNLPSQLASIQLADLDCLHSACQFLHKESPYLEQARALRETSVKDSSAQGDAKDDEKNALVDVFVAYMDILKALASATTESLQVAKTCLTSETDATKHLQQNLTRLEVMWPLRRHIPELETGYAGFETEFKAKLGGVIKALQDSSDLKTFDAAVVEKSLAAAGGYFDVVSAHEGPRFKEVCENTQMALTSTRGNAVQNTTTRLGELKGNCEKYVIAIGEKFDAKSPGESIENRDCTMLLSDLDSLTAIDTHLGVAIQKASVEVLSQLCDKLDALIASAESSFRKLGDEGKLDDCAAVREVLGQTLVLKPYCKRLETARAMMDGDLKAKRNDFAQQCANKLEIKEYGFLASDILNSKHSMMTGSAEEVKQWSKACNAIREHFSVPYKQIIVLLKKMTNNKKHHPSPEEVAEIRNCIIKLQNAHKEETKGQSLPVAFPELTDYLSDVKKQIDVLLTAIGKRFTFALDGWDFTQAEKAHDDLVNLEEMLVTVSEEKEQDKATERLGGGAKRMVTLEQKTQGLKKDILTLIQFGFTSAPAMAAAAAVGDAPHDENQAPALVIHVMSSCTASTCTCGKCKWSVLANPLQIDDLFDRLTDAKTQDLAQHDYNRIWVENLQYLDSRIRDLHAFTRQCADAGNIKAADRCLEVAHELQQSKYVKEKCSAQAQDLKKLEAEVRSADAGNKLGFRYVAQEPKGADEQLTKMRQRDPILYEQIVQSLKTNIISQTTKLDVWLKDLNPETDPFTLSLIVPALTDLFKVRQGVARHLTCDELDATLHEKPPFLDSKLADWVRKANACRKSSDTQVLDKLKGALSTLNDALRLSSATELSSIGAKHEKTISTLVDHLKSTVDKAIEGWNVVHEFKILELNLATNAKLVDYLQLIKQNEKYLNVADGADEISFPTAVGLIKAQIAGLDMTELWTSLLDNCRRHDGSLPPLAIVIQNLKDLVKISELGTQAAKDALIVDMKKRFDEMATLVQDKYSAALADPSADQAAKIGALDKARSEVAGVWKKLGEFVALSNSDDLLIDKLKKMADDKHQAFVASVHKAQPRDVAEYAVNCYRMGQNVSMAAVKDHVHHLVSESLTRAKRNNLDLTEITQLLESDMFGEGVGQNIVDEFEEFKAHRVGLFLERTKGQTFDHVLQKLRANPLNQITDAQAVKLQEAYNIFQQESEELITAHSSPLPLYSKAKQLVSHLTAGGSPSSTDIAKSLATISSCMALEFAMGLDKDDKEAQANKKLMHPHPVQVLGLFRLLRVDAQTSWISKITNFVNRTTSKESHLIQIGTGEGKSIVLGLLSIFLALLGFEVDCVCYSDVLSRRDYKAFENLFTNFQVKSRVFYGTFRELSRRNFSEKGDVRAGASRLLDGSLRPGDVKVVTKGPRILLIDEVDVFFSKDFYGAVYFPGTLIKGPEVTAVLRFIWTHKGSDLATIQNSAEYKTLTAKFCSGGDPQSTSVKSILDRELACMLNATSTYHKSQHRVEGGRIGIVEHGSTKFDLRDGYNTTCWYFQELDKLSIKQDVFDEQVGLNVTCGNFSYAEIPRIYQRILGVTGTLEHLGEFEKKIVEQYNIEDQTFLPTLYGIRDATFDQGIHIEKTMDDWYRKIADEALTISRDAERATLIFWESDERMTNFTKSQYYPGGTNTNEVWSAENLSHYVTNATKNGRITSFLRVFGRGVDFKCFDKKVISQGVHVIQTFLSEDINEEIQVKGRTCRQGAKGSYKMILLETDLLNWADDKKEKGRREGSKPDDLVSAADLRAEHKEGLTAFLSAARNAWFAKKSQKRLKDVDDALAGHQSTLDFQRRLVSATPQDQVLALDYLKAVDAGARDDLHIVFCLDESTSMKPFWSQLQNAVQVFLGEVKTAAPNSRISIIQFNSRATIKGQNLNLTQALGLKLTQGGGGTAFGPALQSAVNLFQGAAGFDPCLVFMTDGVNEETERIDAALSAVKVLPGLQSHIIYFTSSGDNGPEAKLQGIAQTLGGHYHLATDLAVSFRTVAKAVFQGQVSL